MSNLPDTVEKCDGALENIAELLKSLDEKMLTDNSPALKTMKEEQLVKERELFLHYKELVRAR